MTTVTTETHTDGIITRMSNIQFTRGSLLVPYISTGFMLEKFKEKERLMKNIG